MSVFVAILVVAALLVAGAVVFDVVARRRGTYRSRSYWEGVSRRRKAHFRDARDERRRGGTQRRDRR